MEISLEKKNRKEGQLPEKTRFILKKKKESSSCTIVSMNDA